MDRTTKISLLRKMVRVRCFEDVVTQLKRENRIAGPVHTCIGEEAVDVGVCSALLEGDYITGNFRSHGHMIAKGAALNPLMAEIFGKETGTNGGRGGSMHVSDLSVGSLGASAIVGSGIPIACGAAFASRYKKEKRVACAFFGDGASNEGVFYESMNLASSWKLPVLFLLENNGFAITTPLENVSTSVDLYHRAEPFGIESRQVDGQDVEEVYRAVEWATNLMRKGSGPVLIEAKTFLFRGHQAGKHYEQLAESGYRDAKEVINWVENRDPIKNFARKLLDDLHLTESDIEEIWDQEKRKVDEALEFAESSPYPDPENARNRVYV